MLELGDHEKAAHEKLGELLAQSKADKIFLYGKELKSAASVLDAKKIPFFYTNVMEELSVMAAKTVQEGDLVLLKASRGCALEELTETVFIGEGTDVT
jgi:UDP-N-acetylmuramoyl-tripeptide--D-alanyl-D-alanine ligase